MSIVQPPAKTAVCLPAAEASETSTCGAGIGVFGAAFTLQADDANSKLNQFNIGTRPVLTPNKTANSIMARASIPVMQVIERLIQANDKPRAEVVIDVEILEVDRKRAASYGLNLSAYQLGFTFSPEAAPSSTQLRSCADSGSRHHHSSPIRGRCG